MSKKVSPEKCPHLNKKTEVVTDKSGRKRIGVKNQAGVLHREYCQDCGYILEFFYQEED